MKNILVVIQYDMPGIINFFFKGEPFHRALLSDRAVGNYQIPFGFELMRQRDGICQFNGSVSTSEINFYRVYVLRQLD